jgi:hypothetical protein
MAGRSEERPGGYGTLDRPGQGIKPSTWPTPADKIKDFISWYSNKLEPVAEFLYKALNPDPNKPKSIKGAVKRYYDLPTKK